jgi:hypothetical protein
VRYAVVVVRENGRTNSELSGRLLPIFARVRGDGEQGYSELPEIRMGLQVNYLLYTSISARTHAEIQQHRPLPPEVIQRNALPLSRKKTEGRRWVALG